MFKKITLVFALLAFTAFAQELTYEQWQQELDVAIKREAAAKTSLAEEQAKIISLQGEIKGMDDRIASVRNEMYQALGITEYDVEAMRAKLEDIRSRLNTLMALSPEELSAKRADIAAIKKELSEIEKQKVCLLFEFASKISELHSLIAQIESSMTTGVNTYTVRLVPEKRECLWRIAAYKDILNDPWKWPSIYRANKSDIDSKFQSYTSRTNDPKYQRPEDLIFPGQVLTIPRQ